MRLTAIALTVCLLLSCGTPEATQTAETTLAPTEKIASVPTREAFFGDMHVHTSWSTDAYASGNRIGPAEAYRFARGETVKLPNGIETQLQQPLDFVALTDHAEGFDAIGACTDADHPLHDSTACISMREPGNRQANYLQQAFKRGTSRPAQRPPDLCEEPSVCIKAAMTTWERVQDVANKFNDPGNFTALIGYEFSSLLPSFGMLHRNVIFRSENVIPHALSSMDVTGQADFFRQLDAACQAPCEVLTIPHNTNYSWGLTFSRTDEDGSAYDDADIARRARIDRLAEITQQKGNSECQIGVGFSDEDCDFGNLFPVCAEDAFGRCASEQSFVRNALIQGIEMQSQGATNLFKLGLIGSTDNHNSDPGNTNPQVTSRNAGAVGNKEAIAQIFAANHLVAGPFRKMNIGGLAAVWAEANTRDAIFSALKRRETFATSGSRMRIRFFAGDVPSDNPTVHDLYETAVPMGSDLTHENPDFWVQAIRDPDAAPLDRLQIVKGWIEDGKAQQRVWDVACADERIPDANGQCADSPVQVDTKNCDINQQLGAAQLSARFSDPTFNKDQHAFYYVRVFENATCRWTTWLANSANTAAPSDVPPITQQRGWSSPIWLLP